MPSEFATLLHDAWQENENLRVQNVELQRKLGETNLRTVKLAGIIDKLRAYMYDAMQDQHAYYAILEKALKETGIEGIG
jgi:hypothetical protein